MDFTIAIPSYKRPTIFKNKTFKLLEKHNVNYDNVILFLRDEEEKESYGELPIKVVLHYQNGIKDTRNFLQDYFFNNKQYDNVLYIDDDIEEVIDYDEPLDNLIDFINKALIELKEKNLYICSICPFNNTFFFKKTTTTTLKYIMGGFRIERLRRDKPVIHTEIGQFEDYWFTCEYFLRDGGVMRKNWITIKTKYFETQGGICGFMGGKEPRMNQGTLNKDIMVEKYGNMVKPVKKKYGKNIMCWDIRLNHHFKIKPIEPQK